MNPQVDDYLSRPVRYQNIDGLFQVMWGTAQMGQGAFFWLASVTPLDSFLHWVYMGVLGLLFAGLYFGRKYVKRHVTYARTGFAEPLRRSVQPWALAVAMLLSVGMVIVLRVFLKHLGPTGVATVICLANALLFAFVTRLDQFWKSASLCAMTLGTLAIALIVPDRLTMERWYLLVNGFCWAATGATTFILYLRHSHPPEAA